MRADSDAAHESEWLDFLIDHATDVIDGERWYVQQLATAHEWSPNLVGVAVAVSTEMADALIELSEEGFRFRPSVTPLVRLLQLVAPLLQQRREAQAAGRWSENYQGEEG